MMCELKCINVILIIQDVYAGVHLDVLCILDDSTLHSLDQVSASSALMLSLHQISGCHIAH